jgi:hypothetical protein
MAMQGQAISHVRGEKEGEILAYGRADPGMAFCRPAGRVLFVWSIVILVTSGLVAMLTVGTIVLIGILGVTITSLGVAVAMMGLGVLFALPGIHCGIAVFKGSRLLLECRHVNLDEILDGLQMGEIVLYVTGGIVLAISTLTTFSLGMMVAVGPLLVAGSLTVTGRMLVRVKSDLEGWREPKIGLK